jgi:hypothetical protein
MKNKKKPCPYEEVTDKIDEIDIGFKSIEDTIKKIKMIMENKKEIEVCEDEIESEKALQNALDNFFVDELLKKKAAGDA